MSTCLAIIIYTFSLVTSHRFNPFKHQYHPPTQPSLRNQRRILQTNESGEYIDCYQDFDNLDAHDQFLCLNETGDLAYWNIPFSGASYQCLSESDINAALDVLIKNDGWNDDEVEYLRRIGTDVDIVLEGYSLAGYAAYILMSEIFNFTVKLKDFYDSSITVVEYFSPSHINLELYPSDFGGTNDVGISFAAQLPSSIVGVLNGLQSNSYWAMQSEVERELLIELGVNDNGEQDIFLEWWRTYTLDNVIDLMSHDPLNINVPRGNDTSDGYTIACPDDIIYNTTYNEACINDTWYPLICQNDTSYCSTLFQFLPSYNDFEDRDIIEENDIRLKMVYIGGEWHINTQTFILNHLLNHTRALYSIWSPTVWTAGGDFIEIGYPVDSGQGDGERAYKLIPSSLSIISSFGYDFLLNFLMTNDEYDWINKRVWNIDGLFENIPTKINETCFWIKHQIHNVTQNSWLSWIPNDLSLYTFDCNSYGDDSLLILLNTDFDDPNDNRDDVYSEFIDQITAKRILYECISDGNKTPGILITAQIFSIIGIILLTFYIFIVLYFRRKSVFSYSSWRIVLIILCGGYPGLLFVFLSDLESEISVFLRPIFYQTALILILSGLTGKTWRLEKIKTNALRGSITRITDRNIAIRIFSGYLMIIVVIIIMQIIFHASLTNIVVDKKEFHVYIANSTFRIFSISLILIQLLSISYIGILAWKLRDINKRYNESRYIAIILYNTILFVSLILLFSLLIINPYHAFASESLLWTIMVIVDTSVLLTPKIYHLYRGTKFLETGLNKQKSTNNNNNKLIIDKRSPSRSNIHDMRDILKKVGYHVVKKDDKGQFKELSTTHGTTTRTKITIPSTTHTKHNAQNDIQMHNIHDVSEEEEEEKP